MSDLYQILNVEKDATDLQIKKSYFKLAVKWHPDKASTEEEKKDFEEHFYKILNAYKILSDVTKRKMYDQSLTQIYTELRDNDRDLTYHRYHELIHERKVTYLKVENGQVSFDINEFNQNFIKQNLSEQELHANPLEITKIKIKDFNALSNNLEIERNSDLNVLIPKPSGDFTNESFNQAFNLLKETNITGQTKEIIEVTECNTDQNSQVLGLTEYSAINSIGVIDMKNDTDISGTIFNTFKTDKKMDFNLFAGIKKEPESKVTDDDLQAYLKNRDKLNDDEKVLIPMTALESDFNALTE